LHFAPQFSAEAEKIAKAAAERACKVGSGRVGRTSLLPLDEKVRLAVRAHLRHNATRYDDKMFEQTMLNEGFDVDKDERRELQREAHRNVEEYLRIRRGPTE